MWVTVTVCVYRHDIVSMQFMRKYVHVTKALKPTLTSPAAEFLSEEYSKLRSHDNMTQDNIARVSFPRLPASLYNDYKD